MKTAYTIPWGRALRFLPLLALLLVTMACSLTMGGPQAPAERAPVATPQGQTDWRTTIANAKPGDNLTISLTEQELTAIMADSLRNNPSVDVQDPRVVLRDGKMEVYGRANTDVVSANFRVDMTVNVDDQGRPRVDVQTADFGGIPVPQNMRDQLTDSLDKSLQDAMGPASSRFRANQVTITDGLMTVNGTVQ